MPNAEADFAARILRAWNHSVSVLRTAGIHHGRKGGYRVRRGPFDHWSYVAVLAGAIELTGAFGNLLIAAQHEALLPPGAAYQERGLPGEAVQVVIVQYQMVSEAQWRHPLHELPLPAVLPWGDGTLADLTALLACCRAWKPGNDEQRLRGRWVLDRILGEHVLRGLGSGWRPRPRAQAPPWLHAVADDLARTCMQPGRRTLATIAHSAGFSASHVAQTFRSVYGCTPVAFRHAERMRLAARLLRELPGEPIAAIARRCGYGSPMLFSRHIRVALGVSPRQWRLGAISPE